MFHGNKLRNRISKVKIDHRSVPKSLGTIFHNFRYVEICPIHSPGERGHRVSPGMIHAFSARSLTRPRFDNLFNGTRPYANGIRIRECPKCEMIICRFGGRTDGLRVHESGHDKRIDTLRFRSKTRADLRSSRAGTTYVIRDYLHLISHPYGGSIRYLPPLLSSSDDTPRFRRVCIDE